MKGHPNPSFCLSVLEPSISRDGGGGIPLAADTTPTSDCSQPGRGHLRQESLRGTQFCFPNKGTCHDAIAMRVHHTNTRRVTMKPRLSLTLSLLALVLAPALAFAQVNFPKNSYYVGMGDSVAAGEGALPVTNGYVYRLYDEGVFGRKQQMDFSNMAIRGGRSWDLLDHQAAQVLCAEPEQRPTIVTITAGANDFFRGDTDIPKIARRVAQAVDLLLHNDGTLTLATTPVQEPGPVSHGQRCRALQNVTILVSNYYSIPQPAPPEFDAALQGFNNALSSLLSLVPVPSGSRVVLVDLYTPSLGRQGLVTIQRRLGVSGNGDFDVHPTNLGHAFIAGEFKKVWSSLP
jgi:hypothetical protein